MILLLSGGIKWMGGIIEQVREAHHLAPILLSNSICVRYFFFGKFPFFKFVLLFPTQNLYASIGSSFGNKVAPLALVPKLVTRLHHCLATLP